MADFDKAYQLILANEGGYVNDKDDTGGETYRGISRKNWPKWEGWKFVDKIKAKTSIALIDADAILLEESVKRFYKVNFWDKISGDKIINQDISNSIFDFAVNAGIGVSIQLAQKVVKVEPDGMIGNITITAINNFNPDHFMDSFAIQKIRRYDQIVTKRPVSAKYFRGWIKRAIAYIIILASIFVSGCKKESLKQPEIIVKTDSVFLKEYKVKKVNEHELQLISISDTVILYMENTYGFDERIVFIKK